MKVLTRLVELPLLHEFTIARGSMNVQRSVIVVLTHGGQFGYGEATSSQYYGTSPKAMISFVDQLSPVLESWNVGNPAELWRQLNPVAQTNTFVQSAVDQAAWDLFGKINGQRTYETLGLTWTNVPESSFTIGIDDISVMESRLQERPNWNHYKIKLGTDRDLEIIRQLRRGCDAVFRVDANCGWTVDETIANSHELADLGVEFIEQPLPADASRDEQRRVYSESALPIVADESCLTESDVAKCDGLFHGINVKLCKCGGITPAVRMLHEARHLGMKSMVGCMVESSVGISAASQLLPLLDYADLDGAELLADDTADGVRIRNGIAELPERFGNGAELRNVPQHTQEN